MTQDVCDKVDTRNLKPQQTDLKNKEHPEGKLKVKKLFRGKDMGLANQGWNPKRHSLYDLSLNLQQLRQLNEIQLSKTGYTLTVDQVAMLLAVYTRQANTTKALKKLSSISLPNSRKKDQVKSLVASGLLNQTGMMGEYTLGLVADGLIAAALKPSQLD